MTAISWNGVNGDWSLATDWSTGTVPTSADDVAFSATGSYLVTISSGDVANSLNFDAGQAALFEGAGSLTILGALTVDSGFVSLNAANTIGSVSVGAATLAIGAAGALGAGEVTVNGGELLGTANATFTNALDLSGNVTIDAADGTTLNENWSSYELGANTTLNFGASGEDGTILWHTGTGSIINGPLGDINIQAGTLTGADTRFSSIFSDSPQTTIAAGATLDLGGFNATVNDLIGGGSVTDSGAAATLTLDAANFSGAISGALSLVFDGAASLSGLVDMTGGATLDGSVRVANGGTYDIVANTNIAGAPSSFVNNGLVEKTGGGGVSDVTTNFVNNGELDVLSGSIVFSGGFTNNGVIHGIVSESGGITTVSATALPDLTGDSVASAPTTPLGVTAPPVGVTAPPPAAPTNFNVLGATSNGPLQTNGTAYSGPVAGLQWEFIDPATDNLNVTANVPNVFIHTGSGEDAIDVSHGGGNNVLDGSTGSNFLVGGTGNDTFFVDDRGPSADIWSTVSNFHAGDAATIFGITKSGFHTSWANGQGATGFTGLTLHVTGGGHPTASLTLAGFSTADLSNGRIVTSWGTEADGTPYLSVHANK